MYCWFNCYFTFITKEKLHISLHFSPLYSFYCCLMKKGWVLKVAWQFDIQGLAAYKLVAYKKTRCIPYFLCNSYTIFYTRFIYNLNFIQYSYLIIDYSNLIMFFYKRNMFYTWKPNFGLSLSHFLVNFTTTNIDKIISLLLAQRWWTHVDSTFIFNQTSTLKQHWLIDIEWR